MDFHKFYFDNGNYDSFASLLNRIALTNAQLYLRLICSNLLLHDVLYPRIEYLHSYSCGWDISQALKRFLSRSWNFRSIGAFVVEFNCILLLIALFIDINTECTKFLFSFFHDKIFIQRMDEYKNLIIFYYFVRSVWQYLIYIRIIYWICSYDLSSY